MSWEQIQDGLDDKKIRLVIEKKDEGKTLLQVFSSYLKYYNKNRWEQHFDQKKVIATREGESITPQTMLKVGDKIILTIKNEAEPKVDKNISILYEDEHVLVINKTGNLPVHPSGRYYGNTLVNMLKKMHPDIKVINRLDKTTSGIVIFAKDKEAAKDLAQQFSQRTVKKQYIAIAKGMVEKEQLIDEPIKESRYEELCKMMIIDKDGKASQTKIEPLKTRNNMTVLKVEPITGRTHQIRVHLKHIGHPIVNDTLYGESPQDFIRELDNPKETRPLLHCQKLTIMHPVTKEEMTFEAPLPDDMKDI